MTPGLSQREAAASRAHLKHTRRLLRAAVGLIICLVVLTSLYPAIDAAVGVHLWLQWRQVSGESGMSSGGCAPPGAASVAVVSLHRGPSYAWPLRTVLSENKSLYAQKHGYACMLDEQFGNIDRRALYPLKLRDRVSQAKFDKLRYLVYVMDTYPQLQHLLWVDGDVVFTNLTVSVEERWATFRGMHQYNPQFLGQGKSSTDRPELQFVWGTDQFMENSGVMLLQRSNVTRKLLVDALGIAHEFQAPKPFRDQASLAQVLEENEEYSERALALPQESLSLLQGRVRGPGALRWQPGQWMLHLPNHSRSELIADLKEAFRQSCWPGVGSLGSGECGKRRLAAGRRLR